MGCFFCKSRTKHKYLSINKNNVAIIYRGLYICCYDNACNAVDKTIYQFSQSGSDSCCCLRQPLYAIAKKVQWTWPNEFREDHFVVVLGGLHIEMEFMSMIGDVLKGSGCVDALIKSGLGSPGVVESFLSSSHVKRTRYAHEVTACTLYSLL